VDEDSNDPRGAVWPHLTVEVGSYPRTDLHIAQLPKFRLRKTKTRVGFDVLARKRARTSERRTDLRDLKRVTRRDSRTVLQ